MTSEFPKVETTRNRCLKSRRNPWRKLRSGFAAAGAWTHRWGKENTLGMGRKSCTGWWFGT